MIAVMAYSERRSRHPWVPGMLAGIGVAAITYVCLSHFVDPEANVPPPPAIFASILLLPFTYAVMTLGKLHDLREGKELSDLTTSAEKRRLKSIVNSKATRIHILLLYYACAAASNITFATILAPYPSIRLAAWSGLAFLFVIGLYSFRVLYFQRQEITDFVATLNERSTRRKRKRDTLRRLES